MVNHGVFKSQLLVQAIFDFSFSKIKYVFLFSLIWNVLIPRFHCFFCKSRCLIYWLSLAMTL